ncbi:sigma-70 family RNA polymerase sigma factor [Mucilaginibacter sp. JRF]|uniref:RNA polymerase sigma factor n=1 Tax=Mucilaginibacter sp. JRF TaxID=2780088 RepID=UPI00187F0C08|nr:sigma-70 family RNA polymerase sigma factor [Mucilaginibacter sp. JRF]MBE9586007.1 sigma-70 family RNA polymerase sigma factor [Mucilaginibacter sp. JRF]
MTQYLPTPDQERVQLEKLLAGNERAFDFFYDRYSLPVYRKLLKMVKVDVVAEEILQNVFIKVWEKRHLIDPDKGLKAYLHQIAQNLVYDFYRNLAREEQLMASVKHAIGNAMTEDTAEKLLLKETHQLLEKAIEQLPQQQQLVFRLCKQEGKSYEEVGELLGLSTSTINGHIVRATKKVKMFMFQIDHIHFSLILPAVILLMDSKV